LKSDLKKEEKGIDVNDYLRLGLTHWWNDAKLLLHTLHVYNSPMLREFASTRSVVVI
jgi:hypothetical protein